jgi:membrane protein YdbS with pleckstrin-like domain
MLIDAKLMFQFSLILGLVLGVISGVIYYADAPKWIIVVSVALAVVCLLFSGFCYLLYRFAGTGSEEKELKDTEAEEDED